MAYFKARLNAVDGCTLTASWYKATKVKRVLHLGRQGEGLGFRATVKGLGVGPEPCCLLPASATSNPQAQTPEVHNSKLGTVDTIGDLTI